MKFHREFLLMLDKIGELLHKNAQQIPDMKVNMAPNTPIKEMISIDQTNKNPSGKILVELDSIKNFPYQKNIFIKI